MPDIDGFAKSTTSYITWESNTAEPTATLMLTKTEEEMGNWYDYTAGINKWANIKTSVNGNDCYWVWIPRYAYKVPGAAGTIEVAFLSGTGSSTEDVIDPILKTTIETDGGFKTTPTAGNWVIHPAFTNEGNNGLGNLTGIWVAKFEASSSSQTSNFVNNDTTFKTALEDTTNCGGSSTDTDLQIRVVPNVVSWRYITVSNIFTVCQSLTNEGNSLYGATGASPHMMKNTEWGAVVYLSRSQYGKNERVANNNYYHISSYASITGVTTNSDTAVTETDILSKYNSGTGVNASTSGNVYGVYDMAGGVWEYTAGYINNYTANSSNNIANLRTAVAENPKYADVYEARTSANAKANTTGSNNDSQQYNYGATSAKYGDAVFETSSSHTGSNSWDGNYSFFPATTNPVLERGGHAFNGGAAGVFAFSLYAGGAVNDVGFRPVALFSH